MIFCTYCEAIVFELFCSTESQMSRPLFLFIRFTTMQTVCMKLSWNQVILCITVRIEALLLLFCSFEDTIIYAILSSG